MQHMFMRLTSRGDASVFINLARVSDMSVMQNGLTYLRVDTGGGYATFEVKESVQDILKELENRT